MVKIVKIYILLIICITGAQPVLLRSMDTIDIDDRVICQNIGALDAQKLFKLIKASQIGFPESARIEQLKNTLKELITDINTAVDEDGETVMHVVVRNSEYTDLKKTALFFVQQGADLNKKNFRAGSTPLHLAVFEQHLWFINFFIEHGARIDEQNDVGRTALHNAAAGGLREIVLLLLSLGAKTDTQDSDGISPICMAFRSADTIDIAKALVIHGADIYQKANDQITVFNRAQSHKNHAPKVAAYLELVDAFYQVKNNKMLFGDFTKKYLTGEQTNQNSSDIADLLHLGTRQFAQEFYRWRTQNKNLHVNKNYQEMVFDIMKKPSNIIKKLALLPFLFPLPTENIKNQINNFNLTIDKHSKQQTGKFKRKVAELMDQEELKQLIKPVKKYREIVKIKRVNGLVRNTNFYDCKIIFNA